jgi:hypothetical protein
VIDEIIRDLHRLRDQLITELRADEDVRGRRVDAMLIERAMSPATPAGG